VELVVFGSVILPQNLLALVCRFSCVERLGAINVDRNAFDVTIRISLKGRMLVLCIFSTPRVRILFQIPNRFSDIPHEKKLKN
jgi:hypothetical protein